MFNPRKVPDVSLDVADKMSPDMVHTVKLVVRADRADNGKKPYAFRSSVRFANV